MSDQTDKFEERLKQAQTLEYENKLRKAKSRGEGPKGLDRIIEGYVAARRASVDNPLVSKAQDFLRNRVSQNSWEAFSSKTKNIAHGVELISGELDTLFTAKLPGVNKSIQELYQGLCDGLFGKDNPKWLAARELKISDFLTVDGLKKATLGAVFDGCMAGMVSSVFPAIGFSNVMGWSTAVRTGIGAFVKYRYEKYKDKYGLDDSYFKMPSLYPAHPSSPPSATGNGSRTLGGHSPSRRHTSRLTTSVTTVAVGALASHAVAERTNSGVGGGTSSASISVGILRDRLLGQISDLETLIEDFTASCNFEDLIDSIDNELNDTSAHDMIIDLLGDAKEEYNKVLSILGSAKETLDRYIDNSII